MGNWIVTDLAEYARQNGDKLDRYIGITPALFITMGVVFIAVLLCVYFLGKKRRKKEKEAEPMPVPEIQPDKCPKNEPVGSVKIGKLHEQGARAGQQDCFGVSDEAFMETQGLLAVVADGMGGLAEGDKVSTAAVEAVLDCFTMYRGNCTPEQQLLMLAQQAVKSVNDLLGPDGIRKSGTTLVMGLVRDSAFSFLSVGDSRICLYRGGILTQLNREHTYKNKLALNALNGELSLQEVYTDPKRAGLVSFLGMGALECVDLPAGPVRLVAGDKLVLMSDGVYNALPEAELVAALDAPAEEAVGRLRQAIQEKAYTNQDNYTAIIIECEAGEGQSPATDAGQVPHTENPGQ